MPLAVSGYVKNLWVASGSQIDARPYYLDTTRARLTLDAQKDLFRAHVDYDQELLAGSYFRTKDYAAFGLREPQPWLDMQQTIDQTATSLWRHGLYRGWAGVESDLGTARFGRQRIAWGTGKFWNPTDVLNPYQPTTVERDERRGVDAAYGRVALGELSQAELAYAPRGTWVQSNLLARGRANARGYDFSLMGGKVDASTASWTGGGDFAGNFYEGTLHGEWSYVDLKTRTPYWKADLGWDYTWREASMIFEYLHSGAGSTDPARYDPSLLLSGREVTLAQDYFGFSFSRDLTPLVKLDLTVISNMNDGSSFAAPAITFNALKNLYLSAGVQRFGGERRTEFGRSPNLTYLQAQWFF